MGMVLAWFLGSVLVGGILAVVSGRFALPVGLLILGIAAAPMTALFLYASFVTPTGDTSSAGMLSTLILIIVAPAGITTILIGLYNKF